MLENIDSNKKMWAIAVIVLFIAVLLFMSNSNSTTGSAVRNPKTECEDKIDNDGDGYCDFLTKKTKCIDDSTPGDIDCASKEDNKEAPDCEPVPERCDGYDNDCDSLVDEDLNITCNSASDCGIPKWTSNLYCGGDGNVYRDSISYQCNFPGTCSSSCSSQITSQLIERCSTECLNGQCISGNTTSGNTTS